MDRSAIGDPTYRAAVDAVHSGDVTALSRLLDAHPRLLHEPICGPDVYRKAHRHQYFIDPMVFWFVAFNPTIADRMPPNITEVARVMIERGVSRADLDYTLELTMSSSVAREAGRQLPLMRELVGAGAVVTRSAILACAGYREVAALRALVDNGRPPDALLAAALGDDAALRRIVTSTDPQDVQAAFGLAVINGHHGAAAIALSAGADVNAYLPVHAHSTALHQTASDDDGTLVAMLLANGACIDTRDKLWDGTPLDWALFLERPVARAALEAASQRADGAGSRPERRNI